MIRNKETQIENTRPSHVDLRNKTSAARDLIKVELFLRRRVDYTYYGLQDNLDGFSAYVTSPKYYANE